MGGQDVVGIIGVVVQLIFLEGILSIDNAAVLGAMVSVLPNNRPVPYPRSLHFLQHFTDRVLGMQQMAALKVGLLGAYIGRGSMLVLASFVIQNPVLQLLGALYLVKLAFGHLSREEQPGEMDLVDGEKSMDRGFWMVVLNVELADLAFSLDNVVAAVALSKELWVVMLGVALGIVTMRFAAGIFTQLIKREPILETAAYIVVLNIGVELLLSEFAGLHFVSWQKFLISASTIVLCVVYAHVPALHIVAPFFKWLAQGMGILNQLASWLLRPVVVVLKAVFLILRHVLTPLLPKHEAAHAQAEPASDGGTMLEASHTECQ